MLPHGGKSFRDVGASVTDAKAIVRRIIERGLINACRQQQNAGILDQPLAESLDTIVAPDDTAKFKYFRFN